MQKKFAKILTVTRIDTPPKQENARTAYLNWCFTANNPTVKPEVVFENRYTYLVYQLEEAPLTKTPHYQGVVCLKDKIRLTALSKLYPHTHLEPCRDVQASATYCQKPESRKEGPWVFGAIEDARFKGKRNDIVALRNRVRSHATDRELFEDDITVVPAVKYQKAISAMRIAYVRKKRKKNIFLKIRTTDQSTLRAYRGLDTLGSTPNGQII